MGKIVKDSYRVGEEGVILFSAYCNEHKPYIIFREVTKHDFGIDGELELTRKNADGKTEATAEILKVQIKTVNSPNSYMKNETDAKFDFYADNDDLDYWLKHKKYNLPVVLIVIDLRTRSIYAKKITDTEILTQKKRIPIHFDKVLNKLEFNKNDFIERYTSSFRSRIDFDTRETLITNALMVRKFPKAIFSYKSKFKNKKEIFEHIESADAPHFVIKGGIVYLFRDINAKECSRFYSAVIEEKGNTFPLKSIYADMNLKNIYLELVNEHLKYDLFQKHLSYSKDYKRFYFWLKKEEFTLEVNTRTRKRGDDKMKKVVTYHQYGKSEFFRHYALELKVKMFEQEIWIIINPKYLFTKDRKETLPPRQITKYTNYLTAREYNNEYTNILHFWKTYLFKGGNEWEIFVDAKNSMLISDYHSLEVDFGISADVKAAPPKKINENIGTQETLF